MLPQHHRLKDSQRFQELKQNGTVVRTPYFLLSYLPNSLSVSRFGFIATSRLRKATQRNRVVRIAREAIHVLLGSIKTGYDMVMILHDSSITLKSTYLQNILEKVLAKEGLIRNTALDNPKS